MFAISSPDEFLSLFWAKEFNVAPAGPTDFRHQRLLTWFILEKGRVVVVSQFRANRPISDIQVRFAHRIDFYRLSNRIRT